MHVLRRVVAMLLTTKEEGHLMTVASTVHVVESDKMNTWQFDSLDTDVEPGVRHYCPKHHIRNGW